MISARDVEELIKDEQDVGLFDLIEALWGKKTDRALIVLARLLLQMNPVQILSHLARETRLLLQAGKIAPALTAAGLTLREYPRFQAQVYPVIKAWEPAKTRGAAFLLSQHPYVIYNCLRNAPRFSPEKLITLLKALQEMDVAMKTGSLDPGLLLENFIVLAGLPESPAAAP
jgi:DNA polymerase III delta subunit